MLKLRPDRTAARRRVRSTRSARTADTRPTADITESGDAVFATTSSTYFTSNAKEIDITAIPGTDGACYLLLECSSKARTYGLAVCQEGPRT
jgi:hypothetical protein